LSKPKDVFFLHSCFIAPQLSGSVRVSIERLGDRSTTIESLAVALFGQESSP